MGGLQWEFPRSGAAPMSGDSQLPVPPALAGLVSSSGLHGYLHACGTPTHMYTHVHTLSGVSALPPPRESWELNLGHICYDKSPYPMCPLDGPRETLKYFI